MNNIKFLRHKHKLSLRDLAEKVGLTNQFLSYLENEERGITDKTAKKLATFFNVSPECIKGTSDINVYDLADHLQNVSNFFKENQDRIEISNEDTKEDKYIKLKNKKLIELIDILLTKSQLDAELVEALISFLKIN